MREVALVLGLMVALLALGFQRAENSRLEDRESF